jgi:hypothetical protein
MPPLNPPDYIVPAGAVRVNGSRNYGLPDDDAAAAIGEDGAHEPNHPRHPLTP